MASQNFLLSDLVSIRQSPNRNALPALIDDPDLLRVETPRYEEAGVL